MCPYPGAYWVTPGSSNRFETAKARLERDYGLEVIAMPHALADSDFLYCHPEARAKDLMDAFRDPSIRAVFCAIGGDDTIRLLPHIDFDVLRDNPKISATSPPHVRDAGMFRAASSRRTGSPDAKQGFMCPSSSVRS